MINTLFWNIRGISNISSMTRQKKLIQLHYVSFITIMEPMVGLDRLLFMHLQLGFDYAINNSCSSIWILGNSSLDCDIVFNSDQCISVQCKHGMVENTLKISVIYVKCTKIERRDPWQQLETVAPTDSAWMICGDFNIMRSAGERLRGNDIDFGDANEFNDMIFKCGLTGFTCLGSAYTWGQRMWQKLDCLLCNAKW